MANKLSPGEVQTALALCQAACYAAMSAKDIEPQQQMFKDMTRLVTRLTDLALDELADEPAQAEEDGVSGEALADND